MTLPTEAERVEAVAQADNDAVDAFAIVMKEKLAVARTRGRGGWQEAFPEALSRMLHEHVAKGDPRDVANFCMFLWSRGLPIAADPFTAHAEWLEKELAAVRSDRDLKRDEAVRLAALLAEALSKLNALADAADNVGVQYFDTDDMSEEVEAMQTATLEARDLLARIGSSGGGK